MRSYKHKKSKPRPANKTDRKLERASHDGFLPVHHEGGWLFKEGKPIKNYLTRKESQAIEEAFKRKGLKKERSVAPPEIW